MNGLCLKRTLTKLILDVVPSISQRIIFALSDDSIFNKQTNFKLIKYYLIKYDY